MSEEAFWVSRAADASDDDLYEDIARFSIGTKLAQDVATASDTRADIPVGLQAIDDLRELGIRIFYRIASEMYGIICGDKGDDNTDRKRILEASGISDAAAIAVIAGIIGATFGLGGAICAAAGALILKRIIKPAGSEVCKFWKERYL